LLDALSGDDKNWLRWANNLLQYYLGINGDELSDDQWINKMAFLIEIRKREAAKKQLFEF